MALTCTPGGSTDNCYITLVNANAKFANTLRNEKWLGFASAKRELALMQATGEIEQLGGPRVAGSSRRPRFNGGPKNTDYDVQRLHFPRSGDTDGNGNYAVPEGIEIAVCEQAYWLLDTEENPQLVDFASLQASGVKSISIDGISASLETTDRPENIAPLAWRAIKPFIVRCFPVN